MQAACQYQANAVQIKQSGLAWLMGLLLPAATILGGHKHQVREQIQSANTDRTHCCNASLWYVLYKAGMVKAAQLPWQDQAAPVHVPFLSSPAPYSWYPDLWALW